MFLPISFDTLGFLTSEAMNFLSMVHRVVHGTFSAPKSQSFVFGRISFAIQKGLWRSFLSVCTLLYYNRFEFNEINYFKEYCLIKKEAKKKTYDCMRILRISKLQII